VADEHGGSKRWKNLIDDGGRPVFALKNPGGLGRRLAGLVLLLQLALPIILPQVADLDRSLVPDVAVDSSVFQGSFRSFAIDKETRPGPLPRVRRLTYPREWLDGQGQSSAPLAVFIDGRRAAWLQEEPYFEHLGPSRIYAYLREPASQSLFVVCREDVQCARVDLIRDDMGARVALAWKSRGDVIPTLTRIALELVLAALLIRFVSVRLSGLSLAILILAEGGLALGADPDQEGARAMRALALILIALVFSPALAGLKQFLQWCQHVLEQPAGVARLQKGTLFTLVAVLSAWPGLRTVSGWYPGGNHDSQFYLFAASRFLRTGDLVDAIFSPDSWRYSAYPLILALFSRVLGMHPMDAYTWASVLGAVSMTLACGSVAWIATGRVTTGLLATWIAGTWGGLAGWAFLLGSGQTLFENGLVAALNDDYYEPRFFGEFAGPYSELTTYLTSAPFYPREAGLIPFWLGLALLYRRLRPWPGSRSLITVWALFLISAAMYPYYGLAAVLAFGVAAIGEGAGDADMRRQRNRTFMASLAMVVPVLVIADLTSRAYRGWSVWAWLLHFFDAAPIALSADNEKPSLDFLLPRILSGEFFLGISFFGALALGLRPKDSLSAPQQRAVMASLWICLAHGLLSQASRYFHLLSFNFRWFVSWRAVLTPVLAMVAALFVERLVAGSTSGRARLIVMSLIPALSGFMWSLGVTDYLARERASGRGRGLMAGLWSEYKAHGSAVLGKVIIPEPMLIENSLTEERAVASAAFGVVVTDVNDLGGSEAVSNAAQSGLPPNLGSAALRRQAPLAARLLSSGCCERLASYGAYDIYVRKVDVKPAASGQPR
jgi:hypothetical protein